MNNARWKWVSGAVAVLATATLQAQMPAPAVALSFSEESVNENGAVKLPLDRENVTSGPNPAPEVEFGLPGVGT